MKKQAFGMVGETFPDYKGESHPITVGSVVEIDLDKCNGMRGLMLIPAEGFIPIWHGGDLYYWRKRWISDYWFT